MKSLAFFAMCTSFGWVVIATIFPQEHELKRLTAQLEEVRAHEKSIQADKEYHQLTYRSLKEDTAYLEVRSRDRLDLCDENERVLKFKR